MKIVINDGAELTPEIISEVNNILALGPLFTLRSRNGPRPGWMVAVEEIVIHSERGVLLYGYEKNLTTGRAWYELSGTKASNYILEAVR